MATLTVPAGPGQPLFTALTEYVPASAVPIPATVGFCKVEVKPFGPLQVYVAPDTVLAVKLSVVPVHNGLLLPTEGAAGRGLTVAEVVVIVLLAQPVVYEATTE
jgi:hypothetical protein